MRKTAIIIPCFNESGRFRVKEFAAYINADGNVYFIFVNDGSTDNTREIIKDLYHSFPNRVVFIDLKKNCGKAEAVRCGILKALEMDYENIGYFDADLSTPLSSINIFCELLDKPETTIVMGARVKLLGRKIERRAFRHYLGRVFAASASIILGVPVYDTQCGAKIFKNTKDLNIIFSKPFITKWIFDVEILARFKLLKWNESEKWIEESVVEYPLEEWIHIQGSHIKFIHYFKAISDLIKIFVFLHRKQIFLAFYIRN
ncbi:MAG: glycosyltransferase [Desulfobacteraceae bacterium]|nr:MAG: glycosyltransferase [Desulfobacteraceae bacterium]